MKTKTNMLSGTLIPRCKIPSKLIQAALAIPLLILPVAATATIVYVDNFSTTQAELKLIATDGVGANTSSSKVGNSDNIIGGERDSYIKLLGIGRGDFPGIKTRVSEGVYYLDLDTQIDGTATLQWDGNDNSPNIDATGLRNGSPDGIDITFGNTVTDFQIATVSTDHDFEFRISVYTDGSNYTQVTLQTLVNPPTVTMIPFSFFDCQVPIAGVITRNCVGSGADPTNVGALQVEINPDGTATSIDLVVNSIFFDVPDGPLACRVTAGLQDTWTPDLEVELIRELMIDNTSQDIDNYPDYNFYTAGGQAGAHTGQQPQPSGEWTHTQHRGAAGMFTFHGGTKSAPKLTEVDVIRCSDPGGCSPSGNPPSPVKQIDFDGIGTFKNLGKGKKEAMWLGEENRTVTAEGHGNKEFAGTFHWFEVNMDDLGEPGNKDNDVTCPYLGFGEKGVAGMADCDCADFYRITIYDGVLASDVVKNLDGSIDTSKLPHNPEDIIYQVWGYIDGGNLQIHHPTGFDNP